MTHSEAKLAAGKKALEFVEDGMRLGLGTGSTSKAFIEQLIQKCKEGLKVEAVATSRASEILAHEGGIPMLNVKEVTSLDLTVDGADEIDPEFRLIKGAGGALLREKIIASMSNQMLVIADESKMVKRLGKTPLPVEVVCFAAESTKKQLERLGFKAHWRTVANGTPYVTDNHNWICDLDLGDYTQSPEEIHMQILQIPGVVETGFFFNLAERVVLGHEDGSSRVMTKE